MTEINRNEVIKNSLVIKKPDMCSTLEEETQSKVFELIKETELGCSKKDINGKGAYICAMIKNIIQTNMGKQIIGFDYISYSHGVFYGFGSLDPDDSWNQSGFTKFIFYEYDKDIYIKRGFIDKGKNISRYIENVLELDISKRGLPFGKIIIDGILYNLYGSKLIK